MKWHCSLLGWLYGERTCTDELGRIVGEISRHRKGGYEIEAYHFGTSWEFENPKWFSPIVRYVHIDAAKRGVERLLASCAQPAEPKK